MKKLKNTVKMMVIPVIMFLYILHPMSVQAQSATDDNLKEAAQPVIIVSNEIVTDNGLDDTFQYVAFGNSVTCNGICDYWWGTWGMAATTPDNDYVHIVSRWLEGQTGEEVEFQTVQVKDWEDPENGDRNAVLDSFDEYLSENTDLITLQIGENMTSYYETLEPDFRNLLDYLKEKAPNAQIIILPGLLWPFDEVEAAKRNVCAEYEIPWIDMSDYYNGYDSQFRSAIGNEVYGEDGQLHAIWHEVVAAHPNDEGMAKIAQTIIDNIQLD